MYLFKVEGSVKDMVDHLSGSTYSQKGKRGGKIFFINVHYRKWGDNTGQWGQVLGGWAESGKERWSVAGKGGCECG